MTAATIRRSSAARGDPGGFFFIIFGASARCGGAVASSCRALQSADLVVFLERARVAGFDPAGRVGHRGGGH